MYRSGIKENKLSASFSAAYHYIDLLCEDVEQLLLEFHLSNFQFDIILGIREALTNAVRHGSKLDVSKEVSFFMEISADEIIIHVSDSGPGFDWQESEKKCADASEVCGRGLTIFKLYFDSYIYNRQGNKLTLIKKIAELPGPE